MNLFELRLVDLYMTPNTVGDLEKRAAELFTKGVIPQRQQGTYARFEPEDLEEIISQAHLWYCNLIGVRLEAFCKEHGFNYDPKEDAMFGLNPWCRPHDWTDPDEYLPGPRENLKHALDRFVENYGGDLLRHFETYGRPHPDPYRYN